MTTKTRTSPKAATSHEIAIAIRETLEPLKRDGVRWEIAWQYTLFTLKIKPKSCGFTERVMREAYLNQPPKPKALR